MPRPHTESSSKWIKDLKIFLKKETIEENNGEFLYNLGVMKAFLIMTQNPEAKKEEISFHIRLLLKRKFLPG